MQDKNLGQVLLILNPEKAKEFLEQDNTSYKALMAKYEKYNREEMKL